MPKKNDVIKVYKPDVAALKHASTFCFLITI